MNPYFHKYFLVPQIPVPIIHAVGMAHVRPRTAIFFAHVTRVIMVTRVRVVSTHLMSIDMVVNMCFFLMVVYRGCSTHPKLVVLVDKAEGYVKLKRTRIVQSSVMTLAKSHCHIFRRT